MLNDQRIAKGEGPIEKAESDRVWVWPDLVYTELISLILCSVVLIVWAIVLKAPLEQPANRAVTPNPSKAPWYFLGLQEMLVYFDPWLAGVVLPSLIIVGLIAIPYIDKNPKGNGYFTFNERKFEITLFLFGFVAPVVVADRARHVPSRTELELLRPVRILGHAQARGADQRQPVRVFLGAGAGSGAADATTSVRELPGILLSLFYVLILPVLLARTLFKSYVGKLGAPRFYVTVFLFLMMMSLPVKMLLRWVFNLKYIVAIPEIFFNI